MKKNLQKTPLMHICVFIIFLLGLTACSPLAYQVIELKSESSTIANDAVVFENAELKVSYNFWSQGGQIAFSIFNNSNEPLYIDWDRTHLIYDGYSYEYWFDIENNTQVSVTKSGTVGVGSVSYYNISSFASYNSSKTITSIEKSRPKKVMELPPQSAIYVQKFHILNGPYFTCDFTFKHNSSEVINLTFEKSKSPIVFRNYITYSNSQKCDSVKVFENQFYASKISNMSQKEFKGKNRIEKKCDYKGKRIETMTYEYPYYQPDRFYWNTFKK